MHIVFFEQNPFKRENMKKLLLALFFVVGITCHAGASIIDAGAYTRDTDTMVDWYDLTASVGISYNDMVVNLSDTNSQFYGWRHATISEITTLMTNAGISNFHVYDGWNDTNDPTIIAAMDVLKDLLGQTGTNAAPRSDGMFDDEGYGDPNRVGFAFVCVFTTTTWGTAKYIQDYFDVTIPYTDNSGSGSGDIGHWLVRDSIAPVPEPSTILLFSIGLLGITGISRRKK